MTSLYPSSSESTSASQDKPTKANESLAAFERIQQAYDPEFVRRSGQILVDSLANHFAHVQTDDANVLNWHQPEPNIRKATEILHASDRSNGSKTPEELSKAFGDLIAAMLQHGQNLHNPRYIGHQVPAPSPVAGWFDALGSMTNQVMAIYEMGPWATSVERTMVAELGTMVGYEPDSFSGVVTSGGSIANLTALLTARNVVLNGSWENGIDSKQRPALVVQADAHYAISRSAGILGLGTSNIVKAELDDRRRMDPQKLDETLAELRRSNRPIIAVACSSCATPIGAFDPLDQIAEVCRKHDAWMHVDAAHGGSALFSRRYRSLMDGVAEADSVVWDAHKMMFVPALCAFVFYKQRSHQFETFRQNAPYLFDPSDPGMAEYDSGTRTLECTKRAATYGLWGLWSLFGRQLFEDLVDLTFDRCQSFFEKLSDAEDFQTLHKPQCNIIAFRHIPEGLKNADENTIGRFQHELRRNLIHAGRFYIVQTTINGTPALRATVMNPLTTDDHLDGLLDEIRTRGQELL